MAHTGVDFLVPIVLSGIGVLSVADGYDAHVMEFSGILWDVDMTLGVLGTTSDNTDVVVERTPSGGSAGDLWTPASGCGRIAYNASAKYLNWDWENANMTGYASGQIYPPSGARLDKGDTLKLNVNAIPGGSDSADLKVVLWVKPTVD